MTDPIRDDAITAAAKVRANANQPARYWDRLTGGQQDHYRRVVAPLVDAVLAVARPAYRAEALGYVVIHRVEMGEDRVDYGVAGSIFPEPPENHLAYCEGMQAEGRPGSDGEYFIASVHRADAEEGDHA